VSTEVTATAYKSSSEAECKNNVAFSLVFHRLRWGAPELQASVLRSELVGLPANRQPALRLRQPARSNRPPERVSVTLKILFLILAKEKSKGQNVRPEISSNRLVKGSDSK